jgi:flavin-dependent dehydrogenase
MDRRDVLIVGGSVAGAALAIHLGRRGLRAVVFDKARFPRRKACGEGLLPHGAAELQSLGLGDPPGTRVHGLRYFSPSGDSAAARFDECGLGPGWVVHRDVFDRWLLRHARATPNVRVEESTSISAGEAEASGVKIVVGADGLHSIFHARPPFRRSHPRRARVGMSAVVRGYPAGDTVDIYLGAGGEAYVGPGANGETSLALLLEKGVRPDDLLAKLPAFRDIEIVRTFIGAGPLGSVVDPIVDGRVLLIGDAAGAVDPISGEGMSLALLSARAAAEAIHEAIDSDDLGALEGYAAARRGLMAPAAKMAGLLLKVSRHAWVSNRAVRKLSRDPALFGRWLRAACGAGFLGPLEPVRLVL